MSSIVRECAVFEVLDVWKGRVESTVLLHIERVELKNSPSLRSPAEQQHTKSESTAVAYLAQVLALRCVVPPRPMELDVLGGKARNEPYLIAGTNRKL